MADKDLVLRLLINAHDNTGGATRAARDNLQTLSTAAEKVSALIKGYLTFRVVIEGAGEFIKLSDTATLLKSKLDLATRSHAEFNAAEESLFSVAQRTRTALETVTELYVKTDKTLRDLGKTQADSIAFNQLITESFKLSGATAAESGQGIRQLVQGLQSGVLHGDEFNTVMEAAPRLAQALADGLGVPVNQLRALAEAGKLTSEAVAQALLGQAPKIAAEYAQMGPTVEGAVIQMENALLRYVGKANDAHGVTAKLAGGITSLSQHVDDLAHVAEALGTVLLSRMVIGFTAATSALVSNSQASRQKAAADALAATELRNLMVLQQSSAQISAKIADLTLAEARARFQSAEAAALSRQAAMANAQASVEAAAAIEIEIAAQRSAVIAARERLATASTISAATAAEAELTAAIEAEGRQQWTAAAAAKAHSDALGKLIAAQVSSTEAAAELTAAETALNSALARNRETAAAAAAANLKLEASTVATGKAAKTSGIALEALNAILLVPLAWDFGQTIGEWATQFEKVRIAGSYLAEMFTHLGNEWRVLTGQLSWDEYVQETQRIADEYENVREGLRETVRAQENASAQATQAVQTAQAAQREALDKSSEKLKAATKILEDQYARQAAAIDQALSTKLAKIAASGQAENIQAQLSAQAERQSLTQRLAALDEYGKRRLDAIAITLGSQEEIERQGEVVRKATEQASLQARIDAYGDLAKGYAGVVNDLQSQWQRELTLFSQGNEDIKSQQRDVEQTILNLKRLGMTEREKLRSQEKESQDAIAKYEAEAAKGKQANENELNRLFSDAIKLVNGVSTAKANQASDSIAKNGAIKDGETAIAKLWTTQKATLEEINGQHKANAEILTPSLEKAKTKLEEVNTQLQSMDKQLAASKELKISLDQSSVNSAQAAIGELTKPETKVITIQTVTAGEAAPVQTKAGGGLIAAFARGGKLPGYGGGDTVPAMLEPGEFIVNKRSTAAALPLLQALNSGRLPGFADGGLVESAFERAFTARLDEKIAALGNLGFAASSSIGGPAEWRQMVDAVREIQTAIDRGPQAIREKLRASVAGKLQALLDQSKLSLLTATDNAFNPLSTLQNSPGLIDRLQSKAGFFQNAIAQFGGQDLGSAFLGGFAPPSARGDLKFAMPNFTLPDVSGQLKQAMGGAATAAGTRTEVVRHVFDFGGKQTAFDVTQSTDAAFRAGLADLVDAHRRAG